MLKHVLLVSLLLSSCAKKEPPAASGVGVGSSIGSATGAGSASGSSAGSSAGSNAGSSAGSAGAGSGSGSAAVEPIRPYSPGPDVSEAVRLAVTAPDRTDDDRRLDAGRMPGEVLTFFKIAPGQKVAEIFAGGGYTTELLARVVGPGGKVWAQNTTEILEKFARGPWTARAARPAMAGVVAVERATEDPLPPEATKLDAVINILTYHDTVWTKVDRVKMNKAIFAALAPGGVYGIVDHSAVAGSGIRDAETLHRIDEAVVKEEIVAAGFRLDGELAALRAPSDTRDWNSSPRAAGERRGTSDRFVLRFVKP